MVHKKTQQYVDLYKCPSVINTDANQITLGDLHANAMLLMYFLVSNGVVKLTDETYEQLKKIYLKTNVTRDDILQFNAIIDALEIVKKPLVRLIGDEVCDRGQNDYFILKILDKLKHSGVQTEVLLSNHGIEFITPFEKKAPFYAPLIDIYDQANSLNNMRRLINNNVISREEINLLVNQSYLPTLKLISYSLENNNITIYSHAGVGLETIQSLAKKFSGDGVVYRDSTIKELAQTIDSINAVLEKHKRRGTVHTLPINLSAQQINVESDPVTFLLWNRAYDKLSRQKEHKGYNIHYVHGHDSGEISHDNIINLDHQLGKALHLNSGTYIALESKNQYSQPGFNFYLLTLKQKADLLLKDGHKPAHQSAMAIYDGLISAYESLKDDRDFEKFNKSCNHIINENRGELDKHRGWSAFLINLAIAIPTFGIGLLIKGAVNLSQNRHFLFVHKTKSAEIVDDVIDKINSESPKPS